MYSEFVCMLLSTAAFSMLALLRKYISSAARSSSSDFFRRKYVIPITRADAIIIADSVIIIHLDTI
ncbi:hypothetical protein FR483_n332L [Paramecium bursaria Chlorella virus FR483]|uniref:Uncharacterized protein n332L n=1 Tax=Paramecium bursaria Chlorella virus FR483 TaxID=399781 RepID=A7J736_PBCVF|nr:hypothetical protein FR483_n332L [Paramecium bursaria Chlorella virus FR483]ABT15617.1 hypothetical protein FR483_n332L [Paramecium bursaria Chlorella virus FR483]